MDIIYLLIGVLLGAGATFFILKYKFEANTHAQITIAEIQEHYIAKTVYEDLQRQTEILKRDLAAYQKDYEMTSRALAAKEQFADNLQQKLVEQKRETADLQQRLTAEFENIANKLLEEKSQKFTTQNQLNLNHILDPLKERIKDFEARVERTYKAEAEDRISLKNEISKLRELNTQLSADASQLTSALKGDSKTQGDWGEYRLELLLEKAGLTKGVHFETQNSFRDEHGRQKRPDFIINLPDAKQLIIDCKVSLTAYEAYYNAENEADRSKFLKAHILSIRNHLKDLSSKNYQQLYQINSPDYLLLFVPIEPAFAVAVQAEQDLFLEALEKNIVIVTTSTLLATMRTVSYMWKQERQQSNVLEIARQSGLLYDKFCGFVQDLEDIGKALDTSQGAFHRAMNKLTESKKAGDTLIGRAERIRELGAEASKMLPKKFTNN